jgi:pyruvate/2-oxoglutarate dehydrogenase complex dihydrolipoamide acyltransferase (E2) component
MIAEVIIPKTGLNVEDCLFLEWLVEEGSPVVVGQPLFRMETEKVEMEVEADDAGYLHRIGIPDTKYPIGSVIGYIADTEDSYRNLP